MIMKIIYLFLSIILYVYFPEKFNIIKNILQNFSIKIAYNIIYLYGVCEIKCNQIYNYILPYFKKYNIFLFMSDNSNSVLINNQKIEVEVFDIVSNISVFKNDLDKFDLDNFDLDKNSVVVLITEPSHINKKIIYEIQNLNKNFELSEISFIAVYLNYDNNRYHINLKTNKYNYYLVGNIINKLFLQYYINTVLNNINFIIDDKKSYSLELMDHEVNIIYLGINDSIIIEKNSYHINKENLKEVENVENVENDIK